MFANCPKRNVRYWVFANVKVSDGIESLNAFKEVSIRCGWVCWIPKRMPDNMLSWIWLVKAKSDLSFILEHMNPRVRIEDYFTI